MEDCDQCSGEPFSPHLADNDDALQMDDDNSSKSLRWYAVQVVSNYEAKIKKTIENDLLRRKDVKNLVGRIVFPVEMISEIRGGRKQTHAKKLYPGYLFMELDLYEDSGELRHNLWQFIRTISGVRRFLGGDKPVSMKQEEIDTILSQMELGKSTGKFKSRFSVGDLVKVTDGPFAGSEGEIGTVDEEMGRVCVLVGLFGRSPPVDLEFWQIVKKEV
jgi:transcriptional antiterminator NusG